jgi:pimeloyl-ACP methyl ester carboxylesterase
MINTQISWNENGLGMLRIRTSAYNQFMKIVRYLLCLLGLVLAIPLLVLIVLAFQLPITTSGILYLIAGLFVVVGLVAAPFLPRYFSMILLAGVIGLSLNAGIRIMAVRQNQLSKIQMMTLPEGEGPRWIGSIIDEQDGLIFGEALFHLIGGDSAREHDGLQSAFESAYSEMRSQGDFSSPIVSTYLNLQQPTAFDAVIIEPQEQAQFGVVFLHGYMGNVTAQCWEIAKAVKELGGVTVCPSTEWTGQWWRPNGQAILNSTFEYLRGRGIQKFYLGGFSNGGFSLGHLASELEHESGLAGLFFIDGFMNGAGIRDLDLPVLIIEGSQDERVPPAIAHEFAAEVGDLGTYMEIVSDHFLIIKQPRQVQNAITTWLTQQINP